MCGHSLPLDSRKAVCRIVCNTDVITVPCAAIITATLGDTIVSGCAGRLVHINLGRVRSSDDNSSPGWMCVPTANGICMVTLKGRVHAVKPVPNCACRELAQVCISGPSQHCSRTTRGNENCHEHHGPLLGGFIWEPYSVPLHASSVLN
jgi:hypothetical protein